MIHLHRSAAQIGIIESAFVALVTRLKEMKPSKPTAEVKGHRPLNRVPAATKADTTKVRDSVMG